MPFCTNRKKRSGSNSKKFNEQAALVNVQKLELEKQSRALEEKAKEQERNLKRLIESGVREQ
jgi:predicted DNA-binding WGR domain protein